MRRILLALVLGALTTVAVAWTLAAFMPVPMYPRRVVRDWLGADGRAWGSAEVVLPGVHDVWWDDLADSYAGTAEEIVEQARIRHAALQAERRGTPEEMRVADGPPRWGTHARGRAGPTNTIGSDTAYGWPLPCLWLSVRSATQQAGTAIALVDENFVGMMRLSGEPSARMRTFRALPVLPRWGAIGADVAFWGAAWWVLITLPVVLRRRARVRRGRCGACGYDLAGIGGSCPECGAAADRSGA
ncbi:MAG TPA: hypothetical protein VFF69_08370 [Phycisphaerales bacterium]|nr:hypothetical protein [Phycisphaerales bacterium]